MHFKSSAKITPQNGTTIIPALLVLSKNFDLGLNDWDSVITLFG